MQNMEYLHAHDCHQNVTHNLMNLKKSMCIGCLWHACQETTRCLQRCLFTVRLMNIQADIQTVTTRVCIVTERIQFASAQQSHSRSWREHSTSLMAITRTETTHRPASSISSATTAIVTLHGNKDGKTHSSVDAICNLLQPDQCAACVYTS